MLSFIDLKVHTRYTIDNDKRYRIPKGTIIKGESSETGNIGYTRHRIYINVREYRRDNHKWRIQRNLQHRVHKTQDVNKR